MASRKSIPSVGKLTPGKPSLADDAEAILKSIGDETITLAAIAEDTGLPTARIVDLIHGPLKDQVLCAVHRLRGCRVTLYSRKGA